MSDKEFANLRYLKVSSELAGSFIGSVLQDDSKLERIAMRRK